MERRFRSRTKNIHCHCRHSLVLPGSDYRLIPTVEAYLDGPWGPELLRVWDPSGYSPFWSVFRSEYGTKGERRRGLMMTFLDCLVAHAGVALAGDVDHDHGRGLRLLHVACMFKHRPAITALLDREASPLPVYQNRTPRQYLWSRADPPEGTPMMGVWTRLLVSAGLEAGGHVRGSYRYS
jgi:hypothetical protein